jgi:hypothetical protein
MDENKKKYICLYAYYEKNDDYKNNLDFFLNNGILDYVDYYFIINGNCSINIPEKDNIKIIYKQNTGYDFGAWSHALKKINDIYDYYIFINTSVIGPYLEKNGKRKIRSDCKNPLKCNDCEYITKNNITLKKHILNKHSNIEEREKQFKYYCNICNFGTFSNDTMNIHNNTEKHKHFILIHKNNQTIEYDR